MSLAPDPRESSRLFDETPVHEEPGLHQTESERARIRDTVAMIPQGTGSLVDVGCGRGDLLHQIAVPITVGTDLARRGIRFVRRPKAVSSVLALPFRDQSFDVVLCAETLEHLDPDDLAHAASELRRVARRAVLVTVPFAEPPLAWSARCPRCGTVFHLYGHRTVFTPPRLTGLFPGGANYEVRGSWPVRPTSPWLLWVRTRGLGLWKYGRHARCPACGNIEFRDDERRLLYRVAGTLNRLLHPWKSAYRWLLLRVDLPVEP